MSKNLCRIYKMNYLPKKSIWNIIPAEFGHLAALRASKDSPTNQENRDNQSNNKKSAVFIITEHLQVTNNQKNVQRLESQEAEKNVAESTRLLDKKSWKAKIIARSVRNKNIELLEERLGQLKETTMPKNSSKTNVELNTSVKALLPWIPHDINGLTQNDGIKIKVSRERALMNGLENMYSDHKPRDLREGESVQVKAKYLPEDDEKNKIMMMNKVQKLKPKL